MVWHFCAKASNKKIELIQERTLTFLLNDQKSRYHELLENCNYTTMLIRRIKTIAMEVCKSLHDLNPNFMKEMFNIHTIHLFGIVIYFYLLCTFIYILLL